MPFLTVRHLSKTYRGAGEPVRALRDVSFSMEQGGFAAVVGASGSGKSTLLHLLGGVDMPTDGSVEIAGVDLFAQKEERRTVFRRRQIGLVYQSYNLVPYLTVRENLLLPLLLDAKQPDAAKVEALAQRLGIAEKLNALPDTLSGGQQQRVAIARAVVTRPALLLADEPTGNLDTANTVSVMALLREIHETTGQTTLMITHNPELALQAQRVITLSDGRIVRDEVRP